MIAAAIIARLTRSSMLEVLGQDYVRTARAKGLAWWGVVVRHALKNALIPIVTIFGLQFGNLLAGAVIVETVFSRPGLGRLIVGGILAKDFPLVQGTVLFVATAYVLINVLVDVAYAYRRSAHPGRRDERGWPARLGAAARRLVGLVILGAPRADGPGARRGSARAIRSSTAPRDALQPPGPRFLLGSDQFGRDVASRVLHGARISLTVGLIAVSIAVGARARRSASCPATTAGGSTR